jgi:hypothetical protein
LIYVYAIADDPRLQLARPPGVDGAPITTLVNGPLTAICSLHDQLQLGSSAEELWQHQRVVEAAMERCTVAPTRFGSVLPTPGTLEQILEARRGPLTRLLARLCGKVEVALRARVIEEGAHDCGGALDHVHGALAGRAAATVRRHDDDAMTAAYLIEAAHLSSFAEETARVVGAHPEVRVSLTGPWPPYSFVDPGVLDDADRHVAKVASDG